jgi:serine/threonine protein kinase
MSKIGADISLEKGRYKILERLGDGGYGIVWQARRIQDGELVALKTIQTHDLENSRYPQDTLERVAKTLRDEIVFLRRFDPEDARAHHLLPLLDHGEHEGRPVMALMLCDRTLYETYLDREDMKEGFPFDGKTLLKWLVQITRAVSRVHGIETAEGRFTLRDLKLRNVLIRGGDVFLSDFGTVKPLTGKLTGSYAGTEDWSAPEAMIVKEVVGGEPRYALTRRMDIYSLGLIIHALITGRPAEAQRAFSTYPYRDRPFGSVGGLTDEESKTLRGNIYKLFIPVTRTAIPGDIRDLPDLIPVVNGLHALTVSMLMPLAEDRPRSPEVLEKLLVLHEMTSPRIERMEIKGSSNMEIGTPKTFYVTVKGQGMPDNGAWLGASLDGKPIRPEFKPGIFKGEKIWKFEIPPFLSGGSYPLEVFARVEGRIKQAKITLEVSAPVQKLWEMGQWGQALIQDPNQSGRLDELEARADKDKKFEQEYINILAAVNKVHPAHIDINRRYWPRLHKLEEEEKQRLKQEKIKKENNKVNELKPEIKPKPVKPEEKEKKSESKLEEKKKDDIKPPKRRTWVLAFAVLLVLAGIWFGIEHFSEARQKQAAARTLDRVQTLVTSGAWLQAARVFKDNQSVWTRLDTPNQVHDLENFFQSVQPAEEAMSQSPQTIETLNRAIETYEASRDEARKIPGAVLVLETKIQQTGEIKSGLVQKDKTARAENAYNEIVRAFQLGQWDAAANLISENKELLEENLKEEKFNHIEKMDDSLESAAAAAREEKKPATPETLDVAMSGYRAAMKPLKGLPFEAAAVKPLSARIAELSKRREALIAQQKQNQAQQKWAEILALTNAGKWAEAGAELSGNLDFLNAQMRDKQEVFKGLTLFFKYTDQAEAVKPASLEDIDVITAHYDNALKQALVLPGEVELVAAVRKKIADAARDREAFQEKLNQQKAGEIYQNIVNLSGQMKWDPVLGLINDNRSFLKKYLDRDKNLVIDRYAQFFKNVSDAESARSRKPVNMETLESAAGLYEKARGLAGNGKLPSGDTLSAAAGRELDQIKKQMDGLRPPPPSNERFVAQSDGTIWDNRLKIFWAARTNNEAVTWEKAKAYCEKQGPGWRMPTLTELKSLLAENPNTAVKGFDCRPNWDNYIVTKLIHLTCAWVWASDIQRDSKGGVSGAGVVDFTFGNSSFVDPDAPYVGRALPVRGGN